MKRLQIFTAFIFLLFCGYSLAAPVLPGALLRKKLHNNEDKQIADQLDAVARILTESTKYGGLYLTGDTALTLALHTAATNVMVGGTNYGYDKVVTQSAAAGNLYTGASGDGTYNIHAGGLFTGSPTAQPQKFRIIISGNNTAGVPADLASTTVTLGGTKGSYEYAYTISGNAVGKNSRISLQLIASTNTSTATVTDAYLFMEAP